MKVPTNKLDLINPSEEFELAREMKSLSLSIHIHSEELQNTIVENDALMRRIEESGTDETVLAPLRKRYAHIQKHIKELKSSIQSISQRLVECSTMGYAKEENE